MDPKSVIVAHTPEASSVDEALLESVCDMGVLAPPLVVEREDGALLLVTGRQRLAAAVAAGTMLPVRVLRCSLVEAVRAAVDEQYLRSTRSNLERAWDAYALQQAEIALGRSGSVRAIARTMSVAVGKAQYLITLGRELTPERVTHLSNDSGVPASKILRLTLDNALRLAATPEVDRAAALRRAIGTSSNGRPRAASWRAQALEWLLDQLRPLIRFLRVLIRALVA